MNDIVEEFNIDSDGSDSDDDSVDINANELKKPPPCVITRPQTMGSILSRFQTGKFVRPLLITAFVQTFIHLDDWVDFSYLDHIFSSGFPTLRKSLKMLV